MTDSELIDELGGPAQVARQLGYGPGGTQRVHNWRGRGIPPAVKLARPDLFLRQMTLPNSVTSNTTTPAREAA